MSTALLTDEPQVARHPLAVDFDELIEIDPPWQPQNAGDDRADAIRPLLRADDRVVGSGAGAVLVVVPFWRPGDDVGRAAQVPPVVLGRGRSAAARARPTCPSDMLPPDHDPDERLGIAQSYAGQVTLLDTCLGAMLEFLDGQAASRRNAAVAHLGARVSLGRARRVGACDDALYRRVGRTCPGCCVFPMRPARPCEARPWSSRSDLWATLLAWWRVERRARLAHRQEPDAARARQDADALRDRVCLGGGAGRAIRTPAWYLRAGDEPELFAKPDDRWEVNNVVSRCREVVEGLQEALRQYEQALSTGAVSGLPPLGEMLLSGLG